MEQDLLPAARTVADAFQIAFFGRRGYVTPDGLRVMPAIDFLRTLV